MRLEDEQGMMAIGVALMLIVVLSLFGGALWQYSMVEMKRVERTELDMQALFLARAGAEAVIAAWMGEPVATKPAGAMDRIYYDSDSGLFKTTEPTNPLGYVDVVVTRINDPGGERDQLTEIVATAVVKGLSKTVKVTTFPHLLGHDNSLRWYNEQNGFIQYWEHTIPDQLVIMRSRNPIHFRQRTYPSVNAGFSAPIILFESALDFSYSQETSYGILDPRWWTGTSISYQLPIRAETIFFTDLILLDLPRGNGLFSMNYTVRLELPPGSSGTPGHEIVGADSTACYGRVYFDGGIVGTQRFTWYRGFLGLSWSIRKSGSLVPLKTPNNKPLAGTSFYFRDGTDLANIGSRDLIPIDSAGSRANEFRDIQPFIWE